MLGSSAEDQLAQTKATRPQAMQFLAVLLFGSSEVLNPLTKRFSLFTETSAESVDPRAPQRVDPGVAGELGGGPCAIALNATPQGVCLLTDFECGRAELHNEIMIGLDQADRGELIPFDEPLLERIKAMARARFAALRGR
jgi:hypothetical protein